MFAKSSRGRRRSADWPCGAAWALLAVFTLIPGRGALANQPHPAVARIMVPERSATSYGTGTLIDVRDQYGLVVTNWHVVRDGTGPPEVVFPNGFRSPARTLKLDPNWDLAALVIWRPPIKPVKISRQPPRPGDWLTICGYGRGQYREATGRCTQYFAPRVDYPHDLVELNVEARQGDSGGPIFNARGELAGVLFGAGQGTTMGSYGGRVYSFLASLAPNIGRPAPQITPPAQIAGIELAPGRTAANQLAMRPEAPHGIPPRPDALTLLPPVEPTEPAGHVVQRQHHAPAVAPLPMPAAEDWPATVEPAFSTPPSIAAAAPDAAPVTSLPSPVLPSQTMSWSDIAGRSWLHQLVTILAVIGAIAIALQLARLAS